MIKIMEDYGLINILLPGTVIYKKAGAHITINLYLVIIGLTNRTVQSKVDQNLDHDSDYFPIATMLDLKIIQLAKKSRKK